MKRLFLALSLLACSPAAAQWQVPLNTIPIGRGPGVTGFSSVANTGTGTLCLLNSTPPSFGSCPAGTIIVGTTTITGGSNKGLLYNNAGVLGNLATANNGVLVTDGSGNPSISITLPSGLSIPSPTITGGSAAFTSGLTYFLTQNAVTAAIVKNLNSGGTGAAAVWTATAANGSGSFGAAGPAYTNIPLLQNRAYVDAEPTLGGIVINNEGTNPIIFGISNTEYGRVTGTGGFNFTPAYQSANPANAAIYGQIANSATLTVSNNAMQVSLGAAIPAEQQEGYNLAASPTQSALVGTCRIGAADTITHGCLGAAGYAITGSPTGGGGAVAVGIFGQGATTIANASVFGGNTIVTNSDGGAPGGVVNPGLNTNFLGSFEADVNINKLSGGGEPTITTVFGIGIAGGGTSTTNQGDGVQLNALSVITSAKWANGYRTLAGAAVNGFVAGPVATGASQNSQPFVWQSTNGASAILTAKIFTDSAGSYNIDPASNSAINLRDGNGNTLFSTSAGFGGSGVKVNGFSVAGVVTNSAAGLLVSSATLPAAQEPAHTGDVTNTAGSLALAIGATKVTSAMLNADVFSTAHTWAGQQTFVTPILGTPASGVGTNLTGTAAGLTAGAAPASGITGTTLASNVVTSSLTTVGTLGSGSAGTGFVLGGVTVTLGSDATGDTYYRSAGGVLTRLGIGSTGNVLTVAGGLPSWAAATAAAAGTLTGTTLASNVVTSSLTSLGTITSLNATAIGAGTPGTGAFTTVSASTSMTSPLHIGGSSISQALEIRASSGVDVGAARINLTAGNNGASTLATFGISGASSAPQMAMGTTLALQTNMTAGFKGAGTGTTFIGQDPAATSIAGLWMGTGATPTGSNYTLLGDGTNTYLNASSGATNFYIAGSPIALINSSGLTLSTLSADTATTDSTLCARNSDNLVLKGTGTLGICLGTSGAQFKTAFAPMAAGLDEIAQLNLLNYRYREGYGDSGARMQYGLTAQDVADVMPDLVRYDEHGVAINFDIGAFLPIALHALQQVNARLIKLENRK